MKSLLFARLRPSIRFAAFIQPIVIEHMLSVRLFSSHWGYRIERNNLAHFHSYINNKTHNK